MDADAFPKSDPLIVLLNEIDILLTQTRLLELHIKRAETAAADRLAQLHEEHQRELAALRAEWVEPRKAPAGGQGIDSGRAELRQGLDLLDKQLADARRENIALHCRLAELEVSGDEARRSAESELENVRLASENELAALRHQVAAKERELAGRHEAVTAVELALHGRIQNLQQELARLHEETAERDRALEQTRRPTESASGAVSHGRENSLEQDDRAATLGPAAGDRQERARLEAKVAELQVSLAEKQVLAECRAAEIADLKDAVRQLEQRSRQPNQARSLDANLDVPQGLTREQTLARRPQEAETRRRHDRKNADQNPSEEHFSMETDETNPERRRPGADMQSSVPQSASEQALRDEILLLRQEAQERNRILQDRNDELVRVKHQVDQLQERLAQLEPAASNEASAESEAERMHTEFQAQLALLQAELSQKEWAFDERKAKARALEQGLREEIASLQKQLSGLHHPDVKPLPDESAAANGGPGTAPAGPFASQRRWRHGIESKRRWRS